MARSSFWQKFTNESNSIQNTWYTEKEYKESKPNKEKINKVIAIAGIMKMIKTVSTYDYLSVETQLKELSNERLTQLYNDWKEETKVIFKVI